jgi:hypothetical protein
MPWSSQCELYLGPLKPHCNRFWVPCQLNMKMNSSEINA